MTTEPHYSQCSPRAPRRRTSDVSCIDPKEVAERVCTVRHSALTYLMGICRVRVFVALSTVFSSRVSRQLTESGNHCRYVVLPNGADSETYDFDEGL